MSWLDDTRFRLGALLRRGRWESELDEELRIHLEMEIESRVAAGQDRATAEREARLALGGLEGIKEECRDSWGTRWIQDRQRDVTVALRRLAARPRYAAVVIGSLALGLGAALVIVSMVDAVLLRPLPYGDPDRLVRFWEITPDGEIFSSSEANLLDFRTGVEGLDDLAAVQWPAPRPAMLHGGERIRLEGLAVTSNFFQVLRVDAAVGSTFAIPDDLAAAPEKTLVLGHQAWQSYFGGDPGIRGRTVDLDGETWTIVGVLPADFRFGIEPPEVVLPFAPRPEYPRGDHRLTAIGRLADGVSVEQASEQAAAVAAHLSDAFPDSNEDWGARIVPLVDSLLGNDVRRTQWVLLGAVGLLLLLACVNCANLFLAQLAERRHELALRRSLGAGRGRILGQVLTEACLLGVLGAGLGLGAAHLTVPFVRRLDVGLPRLDEMTIDYRVVLVAAALALLTGLFFGLLPALRAARGTDVVGRTRRQGPDQDGGRLRGFLVAGEVALATILAVGAGLLLQSFDALDRVEPGFDSENLLLAEIDLPLDRYDESSTSARAFYRALVDRAAEIPGVEAAAGSSVSPFRGPNKTNYVADESETVQESFTTVHWRAVTPEYFRTFAVPLLRGPGFDDDGKKMQVVLSTDLVERLWPGEDPIGRRIRWLSPEGPVFEVAGVAQVSSDLSVGEDPRPTAYVPQYLFAWPSMTLALRTTATASTQQAVRDLVADLDPLLAAPPFSSAEGQRREALAQPLLGLRILSVFSLAALLLAAVGVYGMVAYSVSRRRREIGVRMALGATPGRVAGGLAGGMTRTIGAGLVAGLVGAFLLARFLDAILYRTSPFDPMVLATVALALGVVGALAAWLPARRATRLDPLVALREE